jgi:hypothetical protein
MTSCFAWLAVVALAVFGMASLIRWFEQITDAVDGSHWNRVITLLVVPWMVWLYPSKVSAGRPTAFPRHEPVRGFGIGPTMPSDAPQPAAPPVSKKKPRAAADPDQIAKLREKMREQGMFEDE